MRSIFKIFIFFFTMLISFFTNAERAYKKPGNKILVVSGGRARGVWGAGVAKSLYNTEGGYPAVFGTSTGSLMTPLILLQPFDSLQLYYANVTQGSIFSCNPFQVKKINGTVVTQLRIVNDSREAQDTVWLVTENKGYFGGGLMCVLDVYNANTQYNDLKAGQLLTELHHVLINKDLMHSSKDPMIIIYSMLYPLASTCRDEPGFE